MILAVEVSNWMMVLGVLGLFVSGGFAWLVAKVAVKGVQAQAKANSESAAIQAAAATKVASTAALAAVEVAKESASPSLMNEIREYFTDRVTDLEKRLDRAEVAHRNCEDHQQKCETELREQKERILSLEIEVAHSKRDQDH